MPWCETLRKWVNWTLRWLGYFDLDLWPWMFKVKLYLGNRRPDCHGTKGTGVDRMPWCETLRKWVNWTLRWLGYFDLDLWPWIFKVKLYLGNSRPDCHGTKGTGVNRMPWCETLRKWVNWMLRWLGYLLPRPWMFKVKLYFGNGRPDYNTHYVTSKGTPYFTLVGEIWGLYHEYIRKNDCIKTPQHCVT